MLKSCIGVSIKHNVTIFSLLFSVSINLFFKSITIMSSQRDSQSSMQAGLRWHPCVLQFNSMPYALQLIFSLPTNPSACAMSTWATCQDKKPSKARVIVWTFDATHCCNYFALASLAWVHHIRQLRQCLLQCLLSTMCLLTSLHHCSLFHGFILLCALLLLLSPQLFSFEETEKVKINIIFLSRGRHTQLKKYLLTESLSYFIIFW